MNLLCGVKLCGLNISKNFIILGRCMDLRVGCVPYMVEKWQGLIASQMRMVAFVEFCVGVEARSMMSLEIVGAK